MSSLNKRILRVVSLAVFVLLAYFLISDYITTIRHAEKLTLSHLEGIVKTLSKQIDGDQHLALSTRHQRREDISQNQEDEDYLEIHKLLAQLYETHQLTTPIYTFVKSENNLGTLEFMVFSSEEPYYRHPYTWFPDKAYANLEKGGTLGLYKTNYGHWLSAYAPIYNSKKEVVAYIQVDEKFDRFITAVRGKTLKNGIYCLIGFLLLILLLLPYLRQLLTEEERQKTILETSLNETKRLTQELGNRKEQLKEYAHKLEQSNKDLMDFAHIASHDLKSPIRNIQAFAQLLERKHGSKLDETGNEYLRFIINGAERAEQLITGLLSYSRADKEMGTQKLFYMCDSVDVALQNLISVTKERNAEITTDKMPVIKANVSLISQVLQNLINNGIKYNESAKPRIKLGTEHDPVNGRYFYVEDNGIGIPEEYQKDIFNMFTRLHSNQKYEGSGIGLAFCNRVISAYGGRMWLESTPGKGSTFYFTLPKAMPQSEEAIAMAY